MVSIPFTVRIMCIEVLFVDYLAVLGTAGWPVQPMDIGGLTQAWVMLPPSTLPLLQSVSLFDIKQISWPLFQIPYPTPCFSIIGFLPQQSPPKGEYLPLEGKFVLVSE